VEKPGMFDLYKINIQVTLKVNVSFLSDKQENKYRFFHILTCPQFPLNPSSQNRGYLTHRIFPPMFGGLGAGFFGILSSPEKPFYPSASDTFV
jgi:hypothetical protein